MFKLQQILRDEFAEGEEGSFAGMEDSAGDAAESSTFLRDLSEDDVYSRIKHLPDQLSAIESRFGESLSPLQQRLEEVQKSLGGRTAFEPKFEKLAQAIEQYDPSLAKVLLPALEESLRESISSAPLDSAALQPHIAPMVEQMQSRYDQQLAMGLLDAYNIDVTSIIPPVENNQWAPQSQTHKDFIQWYSMQDSNTQRALAQPGVEFARSMYKFKKWSDGLTKEREKTAESSSARLNAGQQPSATGRRGKSSRLETEVDGFMSVFN